MVMQKLVKDVKSRAACECFDQSICTISIYLRIYTRDASGIPAYDATPRGSDDRVAKVKAKEARPDGRLRPAKKAVH